MARWQPARCLGCGRLLASFSPHEGKEDRHPVLSCAPCRAGLKTPKRYRRGNATNKGKVKQGSLTEHPGTT